MRRGLFSGLKGGLCAEVSSLVFKEVMPPWVFKKDYASLGL